MNSLNRLIRPRSICVFGSGWAENVVKQLRRANYDGDLYAVHPHRHELAGVPCYRSVNELPSTPDASFIGLNRKATVDVVGQLSAVGAGGAVCFASGFKESDLADGANLEAQLLDAANDMPIFGPNCYGYLNYLDNTPVWPDQHGGIKVESGVAIIAQSSNIALNMTMQQRGLPIAYLFTLGNQIQTQVSDLIEAMLDDPRVTAIGLYLEGFGDISRFYASALAAKAAGKPIVAIKVGKTQKAQLATQTHTATLAGSAAASSALLARAGVVEVDTISVFLESLKLLNQFGPLNEPTISSVSCSGGEASLMADLADGCLIEYPDFPSETVATLNQLLGSKVTVANPLDYHTYVWGDVPTMTACFSAVTEVPHALHVFVLDIPRADRCETDGHDCAIEAICATATAMQERAITSRIAVVALIAENLSEPLIERFKAHGVLVLNGAEAAIGAIDAAIQAGHKNTVQAAPLLAPAIELAPHVHTLGEYESKQALKQHGLPIPQGAIVNSVQALNGFTQQDAGPWVLKATGLAHKTEHNAVRLGLVGEQDLTRGFQSLMADHPAVLVEKQFEGALAELIIGVTRDESGLFLLTIGFGGVYAELLKDVQHLLMPTCQQDIEAALRKLKMAELLFGFRGSPHADLDAVVKAVLAVDRYVQTHLNELISLDINPLMVGAKGVQAVDALIEHSS